MWITSVSLLTLFLSGIQDSVRSQISATGNDGNWGGHIGVADSSPYNTYQMEGHVDELKYYYRVLNPAGKITRDC